MYTTIGGKRVPVLAVERRGGQVRYRLARKGDFDPRSFRTVKLSDGRLVVGCKVTGGGWDARGGYCRGPMVAQSLVRKVKRRRHASPAAVGRKRRNPEIPKRKARAIEYEAHRLMRLGKKMPEALTLAARQVLGRRVPRALPAEGSLEYIKRAAGGRIVWESSNLDEATRRWLEEMQAAGWRDPESMPLPGHASPAPAERVPAPPPGVLEVQASPAPGARRVARRRPAQAALFTGEELGGAQRELFGRKRNPAAPWAVWTRVSYRPVAAGIVARLQAEGERARVVKRAAGNYEVQIDTRGSKLIRTVNPGGASSRLVKLKQERDAAADALMAATRAWRGAEVARDARAIEATKRAMRKATDRATRAETAWQVGLRAAAAQNPGQRINWPPIEGAAHHIKDAQQQLARGDEGAAAESLRGAAIYLRQFTVTPHDPRKNPRRRRKR